MRNLQREEVENALKRHGNRILHLAYSYLHNRADAEDVLQDTMVQLLRAAPAFENEEHEKAWLLRVAINLCKNRLKGPWHLWENLPEDYPAEGVSEDSLALFQAVSTLPVKYREVVHLFYYEDATTAEIAAILGRRENAVRTQLSRARDLLRDKLKGGSEFHGVL